VPKKFQHEVFAVLAIWRGSTGSADDPFKDLCVARVYEKMILSEVAPGIIPRMDCQFCGLP
jgi:hypothetical protein